MIGSDADAASAVQWKSGRLALLATAAAFVTAFGLTIALSASERSHRPQVAKVARAAAPVPAENLRVPFLQPSAAPVGAPPAPAIATAAPSAVSPTVAPTVKRSPRRQRARDKDRVAAQRRYGI